MLFGFRGLYMSFITLNTKSTLAGLEVSWEGCNIPGNPIYLAHPACSQATKLTSHTRPRARDHYTSSTLIGGNGGAGPSLLHTTRLRDQRSMWMQDGCNVYMDSYVALNESHFMVTWIIFKNHLLEVGLTQNWETMSLRTLTTIDLSYFIMYEDPVCIEIQWNRIWQRTSHMWLHTTLEGPWPHYYMISEVPWDGLWALPFEALTISRSQLLASCVKWLSRPPSCEPLN